MEIITWKAKMFDFSRKVECLGHKEKVLRNIHDRNLRITEMASRIKYAKHVDEIEQRVGATKAKLKELGEASEEAWEQLKDGVESAWGALSTAIRNAAAKFKD